MTKAADFPRLLQTYFTDRLMRQRRASMNTIASYRDTFRLLLAFATDRLRKCASDLAIADLDADLIAAFLDSLEVQRGNGPRSRNVRLGAIHSCFRYVAMVDPVHAGMIQRVMAIPTKRYDKKPIEFLTQPEIEALLTAPNLAQWTGRRDRALLLVGIQTGLRVSELVGLKWGQVVLGRGAHVRCQGKGRKERSTPLRREAASTLHEWFVECNPNPPDPVFPSSRGGHLSRDAVEGLLTKYIAVAARTCPSLNDKCVSPHVLRHTAAMELLQHGVDRSVIALWLGHESMETTQIYLHANLKLKEEALAKTAPLNVPAGRFRPDDQLLAFLKAL